MHRIDTATRLADAYGAGKDGFTEGDPSTATPPTGLSADWFGAVQEEVAGVVEGAGLALAKADNGQLLAAIYTLMGVKLVSGELVYVDGDGSASPKTRTVFLPAHAAIIRVGASGPEWVFDDSTYDMAAQSRDNAGVLHYSLVTIPDGATITSLRASVQPAAARATVANRMELSFSSRQVLEDAPSTTNNHGSATDDGAVGFQGISLSSLNVQIDKASGYAYRVKIKAGNDGGTNSDIFLGLWVTYSEPGPGRA